MSFTGTPLDNLIISSPDGSGWAYRAYNNPPSSLGLISNLVSNNPNGEGWVLNVSVVGGIGNYKDSVRAATTPAGGNVDLADPNITAIDGVTLAVGDRILLKNQTDGAENGIYVWAGQHGVLVRSTDADTGAEVLQMIVPVQEGTTNADTMWVCTTNAPITIDVTSLSFANTGAVAYTAGTGIDITANVISIATTSGVLKVAAPLDGTLRNVTDFAPTASPFYLSTGAFKFQPASDSTTFGQICNAAGTSFVTFDTTNSRVGIGELAPDNQLHLTSGSTGGATGIKVENTASGQYANISLTNNSTTAQIFYSGTTYSNAPLLTAGVSWYVPGAGGIGFFTDNATGVIKFGTNTLSTSNVRLTIKADGLIAVGDGVTASYPALKRSTTYLQGRLADDSAFCFIQAKLATDTAYTATGDVACNGYLTLYDSTGAPYKVMTTA